MFKSYRVGTIHGIPFKLDITFLIILPVFVWLIGAQIGDVVPLFNDAFGTSLETETLTAGNREWIVGFVAAVSLFTSVALHELGHAAVALSYGYEIESITLWLLGGIAKPAELPTEWQHEFWIAVAGPVVNVVIALGCGAALVVVPASDVLVFLLLYLALLNIVLPVFNMLPAFPLDGGRVLRALLARNQSYVRATRQAAAVGKGMALLLGIVGLLAFNFVLVAIAFFVYIAATSESRQMMLDAAFEGMVVQSVMTKTGRLSTVDAALSLDELLDVMFEERHSGYPVIEDGEFVGIVTLSDVQSADSSDESVRDVMTPNEQLATVSPSTDVMDAFTTIGTEDVGRLPVVDEDGSLVGIITRTDMMRAFRVVTERQRFEDKLSSARSL
ncbi:site-2 protease family protein [Halovenus marina]|uniref:site-2 protease family protein n=1 Tax=Halovenus marina TaxID=3396621 RepID=UPI003F5741B8